MAEMCLGCGLCCDGTAFDSTALEAGDDPGPLQQLHAVFVADKDSTRFEQPCPAFSSGCCSVYASRPLACRSYSCALLLAVDEGEVELDDARSIIATAIASRDRVRPALLALVPSPTLAALDAIVFGIARPAVRVLATQSIQGLLASARAHLGSLDDPAAQLVEHASVLAEADALLELLATRFGIGRWPDSQVSA
ncbi:unannotated protein [freshwater metagenome]|uniref:Unannotated protein n=1 Tax=freshwater metagenome TaxID=449393 RepID=A0A6J7EW14_9ZZZZ|nr:hypothetical protein [Actinomycetota bacterium]